VIKRLTVQSSGNNVSVLILSSARSSVGIDTGLTPKNVVRSRRGRKCSSSPKRSDQPCSPFSLIFSGYWDTFPRLKSGRNVTVTNHLT